MTITKELSPEDRQFFTIVARAAFCNPFGNERRQLDQQIVGKSPGQSGSDLVPMVVDRVAEHLEKLQHGKGADIRHYRGSDRQLVRDLVMFHIYHLFCLPFDDFILRQEKEGESPLPLPFGHDILSLLVGHGFSASEAERLVAFFYQVRRAFHFIHRGLIGQSMAMEELRMRLWNQVFTRDAHWYERYLWNRMEDFSTLLLGETGTGKGTAAAAIGRSGFIPYDPQRKTFTESFTRNFIPINLSQFPEPLVESELFGHRKGAFTGAIDNHDGIFSRCTPHGSIFIDEIGDVTIPVQIKLLQVLQERTFSPVGSHGRLRFNGRVIAATNRPLRELRHQGSFRDDFYYRLTSDIIPLPTLRQRLQQEPAELDLLVSRIVSRLLGEPATHVVAEVVRIIRSSVGSNYGWPGNVRELEQAVRRTLLTGGYGGEEPEKGTDLELVKAGIENGTLSAASLLSGYCRHLYQRFGSYEEVARRTGLDRRTVKRHVTNSAEEAE